MFSTINAQTCVTSMMEWADSSFSSFLKVSNRCPISKIDDQNETSKCLRKKVTVQLTYWTLTCFVLGLVTADTINGYQYWFFKSLWSTLLT